MPNPGTGTVCVKIVTPFKNEQGLMNMNTLNYVKYKNKSAHRCLSKSGLGIRSSVCREQIDCFLLAEEQKIDSLFYE